MDWSAVTLTAKLAVTVCLILTAVALPTAYWVAFSRWRGKFLVQSVVAMPLVLPPTVLGFYILVALGPRSLLGRWCDSLFGHTLPFTFEGLVIASVIYSLPFAVQPAAAAFAMVDPNLISASSILGASGLRTFFRVILPLSIGGVITGIILSFAHTVGEFGVVLMVGGNIPGVTETVSISIFDQVQSLNFAAANHMALVLLLFSFITLSVTYALNRKIWAVWPLHR
jgi:molybdate transport system permease protein